MTEPTITRTDEAGSHELLAVTARAFWDDPLFDFLSGGDLLGEYRVLPSVFRAAMRDLRTDAAERYVSLVAEKPRGFAGWLGPGAFPRSRRERMTRDVRAASVLVRLRNRRKALNLLQEVERRHPTESHWYLALLATDPSVQGRGIGTALLRPVLDRCDAEGIPAYTETQKPGNVSWYGRSGFVTVDEIILPGTPSVWRLWRDPRPHSSNARAG